MVDQSQNFVAKVGTQSANRREFLKTTGALAAPMILPASVFGANAPSNRIQVGMIGCGNQSRVDVPGMLKLEDVRVVAVCDVNRGSHGYRSKEHFLGREPVQKQVNDYYAKKAGATSDQSCDAYRDYEDVLGRDDIDAVVLTIPDHWHAKATVDACRAGKDIYCQKPLSLTVHDGQQMVAAVRKYDRVFQTGSQYRSDANVRRMCELVRNGRVGEIKRATAIINSSEAGPAPGWKTMPIPDGFDYDRWLGPAPDAPYHLDRCLYRFRFLLDYSGGQVTNTGHHATDIVQWALGTDGVGPVEYSNGAGTTWPPVGHLYSTAMTSHFTARYENGIEFVCQTQEPPGFGARIEGSEGWIEYSSRKLSASDPKLLDSKIGDDERRLPVSDNHYRNFIDAVKSRIDPIEPVEVGHSTASICHLGNIAMRLNRQIQWDPKSESIKNDSEANAMLARPYRSGWEIGVSAETR